MLFSRPGCRSRAPPEIPGIEPSLAIWLHVWLSLDSAHVGDLTTTAKHRPCLEPGDYWFQQLSGLRGLDACTRSEKTLTEGERQGPAAHVFGPEWRWEYQIDSNSRWRTCCSTASWASTLQFLGSRQLAAVPTLASQEASRRHRYSWLMPVSPPCLPPLHPEKGARNVPSTPEMVTKPLPRLCLG